MFNGSYRLRYLPTILEETKGFGNEYEVYLVAFDTETELLYQEIILKWHLGED